MSKQNEVAKQVQPVGDDTPTIYGLTLGEIVADRDGLWKQLLEAKQSIEDKNSALLQQSERIEALEKQVADAQKRPVAPSAEKERALDTPAPLAPLQRLKDGSVRLMVTVPADAAEPLLSWAEIAGEDPTTYIQKNVEEALLAFTSS